MEQVYIYRLALSSPFFTSVFHLVSIGYGGLSVGVSEWQDEPPDGEDVKCPRRCTWEEWLL